MNHRRAPGRLPWWLVPVLVAVSIAGGGVVLALRSGGGDGSASSTSTTADTRTRRLASEFRDRMGAAFAGFGNDVGALLTAVNDYAAGRVTREEYAVKAARALETARRTRDRVAMAEGLPGHPLPKQAYERTAQLYVVAVETLEVAGRVDEPLRTQLVRQGRRIRLLADRVFDRGRAVLDDLSGETPSADVVTRAPSPVPDWVSEGVQPGPPLAPAQAGVLSAQLDTPRPTQPFGAWQQAVRPLVQAVQRDAATLRDLTDPARHDVAVGVGVSLEDVARQAAALDDPEGHGDGFTLLRLGVLTDAEAARAFAAASALGPAEQPAAFDRARSLTLIGEGLWQVAVGLLGNPGGFSHPRSGFDPALVAAGGR